MLIEGEQSSLDKQVYGSILANKFPSLVLVPSGGKHTIQSFATVHDAVLSKSIWGVEFFMLCDGDSSGTLLSQTLPQESRFRILSRYHIENYFLAEEVWAKAFEALEPEGSWLRSPDKIRAKLREAAQALVSYATSLAVSQKLRQTAGNLDVMPSDCHGKTSEELVALIEERATQERERIDTLVGLDQLKTEVQEYYDRLSTSLENDTDDWKALIPGKQLLGRFASAAGLNTARAKTLYLATAAGMETGPFQEINEIFANFDAQ